VGVDIRDHHGPRYRGYVIVSGNHQWKEMETWDAKLGTPTAPTRRVDGRDHRQHEGAMLDAAQRDQPGAVANERRRCSPSPYAHGRQ
jgi:hypothetical protein